MTTKAKELKRYCVVRVESVAPKYAYVEASSEREAEELAERGDWDNGIIFKEDGNAFMYEHMEYNATLEDE